MSLGEGEEPEKAGAKPQRPQPPKQEDSVASQEARGEGRQEIERLRVNHRYQVIWGQEQEVSVGMGAAQRAVPKCDSVVPGTGQSFI